MKTEELNLTILDQEINDCSLCNDLVEKFPNSKTVSIGKNQDILIIGEAPANNGWRKSGRVWYDSNNKLLPSGVVMNKLLNIINLELEDTCFLEAIKCYPVKRSNLNECSRNCMIFLDKQIDIIKPKIILTLGDFATKTLLKIKYTKFSDVVGKKHLYHDIKVIPIYHPSPISPLSYKGNIPIMESIKDVLKESK